MEPQKWSSSCAQMKTFQEYSNPTLFQGSGKGKGKKKTPLCEFRVGPLPRSESGNYHLVRLALLLFRLFCGKLWRNITSLPLARPSTAGQPHCNELSRHGGLITETLKALVPCIPAGGKPANVKHSSSHHGNRAVRSFAHVCPENHPVDLQPKWTHLILQSCG